MPEQNSQRPSGRTNLREVALALSLTSAIAYGSLVYGEIQGLDYYLLRTGIRIDDILRLPQTNAVTTEALRRQSQNPWTLLAGMELAILISMFAVMMFVLLFLRLSPGAWHRIITGNHCAGFLALFALPIGYLCSRPWQAGPDWTFALSASNAVDSRLMRLVWLLLVADVLFAAILFLIARVRPFSTWTIGILLVFHCAFWLTVTGMSSALSLGSALLSLSVLAFPFSGAIWLRYLKRTEEGATAVSETRRVGTWTLVTAALSAAVVLVVWYPGRAYGLAHPQNVASVSIEMSRGPCYGSCPVYYLTLHGDGVVEYRGIRFVGVKEKQTARISTEQLMQVLRDLDGMHFFTVEDRAFGWGYDSSSVSISVSVDGKQKRVTADGVYVPGSMGGPKARFLQIADEIDTIVNSNQWVQCNGVCRE